MVTLYSFQLIMASSLAVLLGQSQGQTQQPSDRWQKMNILPVCFESKGDKPGEVTFISDDGVLIGAVKLVHVSGTIGCHHDPAYYSKWGCNHIPASQYSLNVIVTDKYNHVIYPAEKYMKSGNAALWYYLPNIHNMYSNELVFTNYLDPLFLPRYSPLRIWYGEDLKDAWESDNVGRVCRCLHTCALS